MNYNGFLILTDIDGTLTPRAGEVSKENADAIEYFKENGGLFTFATGRMPDYLSRFPFRANAPIVTTNGTLVCDGEGNTLWEKTMPAEECTEVLRHVVANQTGVQTIQRCFKGEDALKIEFLPPKESLESAQKHLIAGHFLPLQRLPVGLVDEIIALQYCFRRFQSKASQGLAESDVLCLLEIQNGIVQIQKQKLKHFSFS